jgi:hypothetical protein
VITEFQLQNGEGTNCEIIGQQEDELWLIIDQETLVKMIQMAFDAPGFTIDHLIDALRASEEPGIL